MYHRIGNFTGIKEHKALYCHHKRFAAQMAWLHAFGYNVIDMDTCIKAVSGKIPMPARAVTLTFDDGFEDFYTYAFPVLSRCGFPATVYILSDLIGKNASWFAKEQRECPPILKLTQIKKLMQNSITIGSHGKRHEKLAQISGDDLVNETLGSKHALQDMLGCEIKHFCYPYGSYNKDTLNAVKEAGYLSATTCSRGSARLDDDLLQLPRKAISFGDSLAGFWWKLHIKNKRKQPPLSY